MIPCLYGSTETEYRTNGIGKLANVVSCLVTEKRNGSYELEMEYPPDGIHAESLINGNIILAKPSETGRAQPFRIYKVSAPLKGNLTVSARHLSYQLNFITVSPLSVLTGTHSQPQEALDALKAAATTGCPFSFTTDITSDEYFGVLEPESIRNCLGGIEGSVLDTYGGEYEWDRYDVILHKARGSDNNVRITYGKNLVDFKMEQSIGDTITGVHPYWTDNESGDTVELPEKVVSLSEPAIGYEKVITLDCSEAFEEQPTEAQLRSYAASYLSATSYAEPAIDVDIDFLALWQTPGYEDIAEAERVSLCDTVHVYVAKLGLEASAKVTETVYDCLLERYKSITLSNATTSSRASSIVTSLVTAEQAKAMVRITENSIRLSVSKNYVTSSYLGENYATSVTVKSWIEASEEGVTLAYKKALENYSTTEQVESLIKASEEGITLSYTKLLENYSTTEQVESLIKASEEGITLSYTKLLENYSTTEQVESLIKASEEGITLSYTKLLESYSTTSQVESLIKASEEGITLSYTKLLENYSTTSQVESLIRLSEEGIELSVSTTLQDYTKSSEVRSRFAMDSSSVTVESGVIAFSSNSISISSDNFTLTRSGMVTATGSITSDDGDYKTSIQGGGVYFYYGGSQVGRIRGGSADGLAVMQVRSDLNGILFQVGSTPGYILNYGYNPGGLTEPNYFSGDVRVDSACYVAANIFRLHYPTNDSYAQFIASWSSSQYGAYYDGDFLTVRGDFSCTGTKSRLAEAGDYGTLRLSAMESASAVFSDMGSAALDGTGTAYVFLDSRFYETVDTSCGYQVFLTPVFTSGSTDPASHAGSSSEEDADRQSAGWGGTEGSGTDGQSAGWGGTGGWSVEKNDDHFIIHGSPGACFDWIVYARQKGYSMEYLERQDEPEGCEPETDDSVFRGDDTCAAASEELMAELDTDYDALAREYLLEYSGETGYGCG